MQWNVNTGDQRQRRVRWYRIAIFYQYSDIALGFVNSAGLIVHITIFLVTYLSFCKYGGFHSVGIYLGMFK